MRPRMLIDERIVEGIIRNWTQGLQCVLYPTWCEAILSWCPELFDMGQA
jgi:hypothetical protein